jgi:threonine aldolase
MRHRLKNDHKNAKKLAKWLAGIEGVTVQNAPVINIVFFTIKTAPPLTHNLFQRRLSDARILINSADGDTYRAVTHHDVTEKDMRLVAETIGDIMTRDFW